MLKINSHIANNYCNSIIDRPTTATAIHYNNEPDTEIVTFNVKV